MCITKQRACKLECSTLNVMPSYCWACYPGLWWLVCKNKIANHISFKIQGASGGRRSSCWWQYVRSFWRNPKGKWENGSSSVKSDECLSTLSCATLSCAVSWPLPHRLVGVLCWSISPLGNTQRQSSPVVHPPVLFNVLLNGMLPSIHPGKGWITLGGDELSKSVAWCAVAEHLASSCRVCSSGWCSWWSCVGSWGKHLGWFGCRMQREQKYHCRAGDGKNTEVFTQDFAYPFRVKTELLQNNSWSTNYLPERPLGVFVPQMKMLRCFRPTRK